MSEKRKSTPKAKALTLVLIVLFLGSCACLIVAFCNDMLGKDIDTVPVDTTAVTAAVTGTSPTENTQNATEQTTEVTEAASTRVEIDESWPNVSLSYKIDHWVEYKDENGTNGLGVLFGAHTTGGNVTFADGRFTVNKDETEVAGGTYKVISDTEVELRYDNSHIATATILETEDGVITSMDFPMDMEGTTLRLTRLTYSY